MNMRMIFALSGPGVKHGSYGNEKVLYKNPRLLYVFSNNSPINVYDVLGLECGVEICVRPLAVFPGGIPWWISPANHTYIQIGSWSAGFQSDDTVHIPETDPNHSGKKCFDAKRANTGSMPDGTSCKCTTCSDITKVGAPTLESDLNR
jgi:hypothetical protein